MRLLIAGDLYVDDSHLNNSLISESVKDLFNKSDFSIVNCEAPIIDSNKRVGAISKTGPNLKMATKVMDSLLSEIQFDIFTLANNHIMDYGTEGLHTTIEYCNSRSIDYVGVGLNSFEAKKIHTIKEVNSEIAVLNFTENEWSTTNSNKAGANPLDIIDNVYQIKKAKEKHESVIVIIHGGNEYFNYPSPRIQKQYRYYIDNGADVIVGHHRHCISGYEWYNEKPIIYSLGNFLFTIDSKYEEWYTGIILDLVIKNGKTDEINLVPVKQDRKSFNLELITGCDRVSILNRIDEYNEIIANKKLLISKWKEFCDSKRNSYLMAISPFKGIENRIIRALTYKVGLYKLFFNCEQKKQLLNRINCESHHDVLKEILK